MASLLRNIETFCARLNAGLAAVAVVLSILVAAELTVRFPDLYQQAIAVESDTVLANGTGATAGF
jgi:hypothetical protein